MSWVVSGEFTGGHTIAGLVHSSRPTNALASLQLVSGDTPVATIEVADGATFKFDLKHVAKLGAFRGPLSLRLDETSLVVGGEVPFESHFSFVVTGRNHLTVEGDLVSSLPFDHSLQVAMLIDGVRVSERDVGFTDAKRRIPLAVEMPAGATTLSLRLSESEEDILGLPLVIVSPQAEETVEDAVIGDDAAVLDAADFAYEGVVAAVRHGMAPKDFCDRNCLLGRWRFDPVANLVEGWVVNLSAPSAPVTVELIANSAVIATSERRYESAGANGADKEFPNRFVFPLNEIGLLRGEAISLTVRVAGSELLLPPIDPLLYSTVHHIGRIESVHWRDFTLVVQGWVSNLRLPSMPLRVNLSSDGQLLATTLAKSPVEVEHDGLKRSAFEFELRALTGNIDLLSRIEVRPEGWNTALKLETFTDVETTIQMKSRNGPSQDASKASIDDPIAGSIDAVNRAVIRGWALNRAAPETVPEIILYANGSPHSITRPRLYRKDVADKFATHGYHGFILELPVNLGVAETVELRVQPACGVSQINKSTTKIGPRLKNLVRAPLEHTLAYRNNAQANWTQSPKKSVIVINQNGADVLRSLLASVQKFDATTDLEWIVIDHGSTDDSEQVCDEFRSSGAQIKFDNRRINYNFSESNNYGVSISSGEYLIFLNNDIDLVQESLASLVAPLADPRVGMVGTKLLDSVTSPNWLGSTVVQHLGVYLQPKLVEHTFRAFECRLVPEVGKTAHAPTRVPAVTGAMFALRRQDFEQLGGFDERYVYGYEDIDLCLKVQFELQKEIICLNDRASLHHRGFTRLDPTKNDSRRAENPKLFSKEWARAIRRAVKADMLTKPGFWLGHRPVVAFAVTEVSDDTPAGDYYTALELSRSLQRIAPVHIEFLGEADWYDLDDVDVLVAMVDKYDTARIKGCRPHLALVAWARNWFDRWCDRRSIDSYDHIWASSEKAADYMTNRIGREVSLVRIATNPESFLDATPLETPDYDYCFTGSRFGIARDIEFALVPDRVRGAGAIFGHGWSDNPQLAAIDRGPLPYSAMPSAYAGARIVVDDANIATKQWGSCNSRVFDALAAGRLVLTNGGDGARELFGDALPVWTDDRDLNDLLNRWLGNRSEAERRAKELQNIVLSEHTYDRRAAQIVKLLTCNPKMRFAIKIAADDGERMLSWGDYHFAVSLANALKKEGHVARIDTRGEWYSALSETDDVVIVLRGLIAYTPNASQTNLLWIISHPEQISPGECDGYDKVFVASDSYAEILAKQVSAPVEALLQCTDPARFHPDAKLAGLEAPDILFVGNSRNVLRESVRWSVELGLDLSVYGNGWTKLIPSEVVKGSYVPNEILGALYASSRWVLCDHWDDMRRQGFISNRVFDVLGSGGNLIVDAIAGIEKVVPRGYHVYRTKEELGSIINGSQPASWEDRKEIAAWIAGNHSFAARAKVLIKAANELGRFVDSSSVVGAPGSLE